ncbi:maleylpyruvate isomerase N-terminal domain-containing protein [Pseudonocardia nematodicida]|uniref:Maleylpyruvate isomerase N-terminal domain-containing protein n=1 Tax=Pseudonocardia nematodicida TaxID=1206997 RepID=A0ABV1KKD0_9PSEU
MAPYPLDRARTAFVASLDGLSGLLDHLDDDALHARSRCRGWVAGDVLAHLHLGLAEMLAGFPARTTQDADTDLATYWSAPLPGAEHPEWAHVRFARAVAAAYARPSGQLEHVRTTVRGLRRLVSDLDAGYRLEFQGHVLEVSDFVATWVVEVVVHHLDMAVELSGVPEPPASGLAVVRDTVVRLTDDPAALDAWDDRALTLAATGREPGLRPVLS